MYAMQPTELESHDSSPDPVVQYSRLMHQHLRRQMAKAKASPPPAPARSNTDGSSSSQDDDLRSARRS